MTVPSAFHEYDSGLNLDPDERSDAQKFHGELTGYLADEGLISGAFLQGSFARKTMLSPLRDIDKVVLLKGDFRNLLDDPEGAQKATHLVEAALSSQYTTAKFARARHAIQMDLGDDTFSFDVVVAFEAGDDTDDVFIIDLGETLAESHWERSNTRQLIRAVAERNGDCGGAFIHQVRHVKHFARTKLHGRLPGLHVEAIAYACITEKLPHDEAAARVFACGAECRRRRNSLALRRRNSPPGSWERRSTRWRLPSWCAVG